MQRLVFAIALSASLAACGGGGGSSMTPSAGSQNGVQGAAATLPASSGTIAAGYIECDSAANIAAGNNCNNYANFDLATATFALTAIAATASGTPIAQQMSGGAALPYTNGAYRVVEAASDGPAVVAISGGPWSAPGNVLSGAAGAYGNRFFVQCVRRGTATLELQLAGGGTLPLASSAYAGNAATVLCDASGSVTIF